MSAQADGVRVLITGGTSGLGAAMAAALLDAGAAIAVTGRDAARAEAAARNLGRGAIGIGVDVREEDEVDRGVNRAFEGLGGLDVLVNNAGIGMRTVNPHFITEPQPFWMVSPQGLPRCGGYRPGRLLPRRPGGGSPHAGGRRRPGGERLDEPRDDEPEGVRALRPGTGRCRGTLPDHGRRPRWQPGDGEPPAARRRGAHRVDP
jgi:short chain dehydrogenase